MDRVNYFKDLLESIPDYRKIVLLLFLIINDADSLKEWGFLKNDINRLDKEFKNVLMQQNEEHFDHIKHQEESIFERILKK